ncbi:hypothetical protein TKK_0008100 [Trichogramma kaykai]
MTVHRNLKRRQATADPLVHAQLDRAVMTVPDAEVITILVTATSSPSDANILLGSSKSSASASMAHIHRRMAMDAGFTAAYREFMQVYIDSGHMTKLSDEEIGC